MTHIRARFAVVVTLVSATLVGVATSTTSVHAANATVTAFQSGCTSGLAKCFQTGGNQTAAVDGSNKLVADSNGVVTINVGESVTFTNTTGSTHDLNFCTSGATSGSATCGDATLSKYGANQFSDASFGTGAPSHLSTSGSSTIFSSPGTYFFFCGISTHQGEGMWGKVVVQGVATTEAPTTAAPTTAAPTTAVPTTAAPTTAAPTTTTPAQGSGNTGGSTAALSLTIKASRAGKKVTLSGTASSSLNGMTLTVQKKSGKSWSRIATATAVGGRWSKTLTASASATYRVSYSGIVSTSITK